MWWRRRGFLCALPGLAACAQFRPLHMPQQSSQLNDNLAAIEIPEIRSRIRQELRNALLDRLNPGGVQIPKTHRLDIRLQRRRKSLAVQLDDTITRYDMTLNATVSLISIETGRLEYRTRVSRTASYNVLGEPFATLVAERDAERRAATEIANQLRALLALHFEKQARS